MMTNALYRITEDGLEPVSARPLPEEFTGLVASRIAALKSMKKGAVVIVELYAKGPWGSMSPEDTVRLAGRLKNMPNGAVSATSSSGDIVIAFDGSFESGN